MLGLNLCLHDYQRHDRLPLRWQEHGNPACLSIKRSRQSLCTAFCGGEVHAALRALPEGRVHTCPFGHTESAVPVAAAGVQLGVLFAGPCWTGKGAPPRRGLIRPPDPRWLADRHLLLRAIAPLVASLMVANPRHMERDRRAGILAWIQRNLGQPVNLAELASALHLSPSRAGHLVKDLFGIGFSQLMHQAKLDEGARLLSSTDIPVSDIALRLGYVDQSHFTHRFRRQYGTPPLTYRRGHARPV